jgi:hypothetical protein
MGNINSADGNNAVQVIQPQMPMLPELFQNAMPVPIPQMQYESGFLADWAHNWKLARIAKASGREADISEHKCRMTKANLDTMKALMTFSASVQMEFKRFEHEVKCQEHAVRVMSLEEKKIEAEVISVQLKNQLLHGEVQLNEVELKIKMKQLEDILNGTSEA